MKNGELLFWSAWVALIVLGEVVPKFIEKVKRTREDVKAGKHPFVAPSHSSIMRIDPKVVFDYLYKRFKQYSGHITLSYGDYDERSLEAQNRAKNESDPWYKHSSISIWSRLTFRIECPGCFAPSGKVEIDCTQLFLTNPCYAIRYEQGGLWNRSSKVDISLLRRVPHMAPYIEMPKGNPERRSGGSLGVGRPPCCQENYWFASPTDITAITCKRSQSEVLEGLGDLIDEFVVGVYEVMKASFEKYEREHPC